jgi:hypothetical protein
MLISLFLLGVFVLSRCILIFDRSRNKAIDDVPAIKNFVTDQMPSASITKYVANSYWDEAEVYVELKVAGKGDLRILAPTIESFRGGGDVLIERMGDCVIAPAWNFGRKSISNKSSASVYAVSIPDLVSRWDEIYKFLKDHPTASGNSSLPGCRLKASTTNTT